MQQTMWRDFCYTTTISLIVDNTTNEVVDVVEDVDTNRKEKVKINTVLRVNDNSVTLDDILKNKKTHLYQEVRGSPSKVPNQANSLGVSDCLINTIKSSLTIIFCIIVNYFTFRKTIHALNSNTNHSKCIQMLLWIFKIIYMVAYSTNLYYGFKLVVVSLRAYFHFKSTFKTNV